MWKKLKIRAPLRFTANWPRSSISGKYDHIKFSHAEHFKGREAYHLDCTTCHYGVAASTNLASLTLPKMADCVNCHDIEKSVATNYRMNNCAVCHIDEKSGPLPEYTRASSSPPHTMRRFGCITVTKPQNRARHVSFAI